jgi:hypothetical protein
MTLRRCRTSPIEAWPISRGRHGRIPRSCDGPRRPERGPVPVRHGGLRARRRVHRRRRQRSAEARQPRRRTSPGRVRGCGRRVESRRCGCRRYPTGRIATTSTRCPPTWRRFVLAISGCRTSHEPPSSPTGPTAHPQPPRTPDDRPAGCHLQRCCVRSSPGPTPPARSAPCSHLPHCSHWCLPSLLRPSSRPPPAARSGIRNEPPAPFPGPRWPRGRVPWSRPQRRRRAGPGLDRPPRQRLRLRWANRRPAGHPEDLQQQAQREELPTLRPRRRLGSHPIALTAARHCVGSHEHGTTWRRFSRELLFDGDGAGDARRQ